MTSEKPIGYAELLTDLQNTITQLLVEFVSLDKELAEHIGLEIRNHMGKHWGGQGLYFPKDIVFMASQRDEQIYNEFKGNNHNELVRKYGVSKVWLYRIINRVHQRRLDEIQGDLF